MIYTVGLRKSYEQYFKEQEDLGGPYKLGKTEEYPGGSVWETYEDVKKYIEETHQYEFEIYGVLADWQNDTEFVDGVSWNNLVKTSRLIKL